MKSSYTPGPWLPNFMKFINTVEGFHITGHEFGSARPICNSVHIFPENELIANASLIAAAPELLEALEMVRDYIVTMKGKGHEYQIAVDSAIAKAKGEA